MTVGQLVWVGTPFHESGNPGGSVYEGTVVAIGDRGEVAVKHKHGIQTWGGEFSLSKVFESSAREAWLHCANELRRQAGKITSAASVCEAKAAEVA